MLKTPIYLSIGFLLMVAGCSEARFESNVQKPKQLSADSSLDGLAGSAGAACWEVFSEDKNGDGLINIEDCRGSKGPQGLKGLTGTNGTHGTNGSAGQNGQNGINCFQTSGDSNSDGQITTQDCRGARGPAGQNGQTGANGINGLNCFDGLNPIFDDLNGDGQLTIADCRGRPGIQDNSGYEMIGCSTGNVNPGGTDPSGLMNHHAGFQTTATCSKGKRLVAAGLVGAFLSEALIPMRPYYGSALLEHGVAMGRDQADDLYPNKIECFIGNRNRTECGSTLCPDLNFPMGLSGWGLCVPVTGSNQL